MYPGQASPDLPADYDPLQHPWYQDVAGKSGKFWGRPYRDRLGQGVLLSCSMPLLDGAGQLLGVAGIDVSLDYVIEQFMSCLLYTSSNRWGHRYCGRLRR